MIRPDYSEHDKPDGCVSMWICFVVMALCGFWLFMSDYWPQAMVGILLALAILMKR